MPRGKANQNLNQRSRHRYAELCREIASYKRRIARDGELPAKLQARYALYLVEVEKLRRSV